MNKFTTISISALFIIGLNLMPGCKKEHAIPSVSTDGITEITYNSAKSGGEIIDDGGAPVTLRGVCWSTSEKPTTADHLTTSGEGPGSFVCTMEGLSGGTTYYVRAYATNSEGTGYGNQITFSTPAYEVASLTTTGISGITYTSAISGGNITDDGGSTISARGVCWSTAENPTVAGNKTTNGTGTGSFVSNITELTAGVTYYVRAYATNSTGTSYGNQVSFNTTAYLIPTLTTKDISDKTSNSATSGGNITSDGGSPITGRGVCWSTSENPTIAGNKTSDETGTGIFISHLTGLTDGTTYYVRAYATNSAGTAYGNQVSFTTILIVLPTITTGPISGLTSTDAVSGGNISNKGGGVISANGVCWSTSENPTLSNNFTTDATSSDIFSSNLSGLTDGTIYYVRAYATNNAGTAYGNQISFITPATDINGNLYNTAKIGNQVWMTDNLKVEKLNNGTPIPNVPDNSAWISLSTPGLCWFNNNIENKNPYGAIYNWFAIESGNLCPTGWHVPTDSEYNTLEIYLGMSPSIVNTWGFRGTDQGNQLKSTSTWNAGSNGTNSSGFNAKAGSYRQWDAGSFPALGAITYYWSSTDDAANGHPTVAWYRRLDYNEARVYKGTTEKEGGKYVRCLKD